MVSTAATETAFLYRFGQMQYDLSARTHIMGVLNVTPDSFFDGGKYSTVEKAVGRGLEMIAEGADFIDVGGESTRPKSQAYGEGADRVPMEEELRRVTRVIEILADRTDIPLSIDTYKAGVARKALESGAVIVNDVSGFTFNPEMPSVVAEAGASAVLMHIKGTPKTMQGDPTYDDLIGEVSEFLQNGLARGRQMGINQMMVDPGIGFGKRQEHNLQLIKSLSQFKSLGYPILIGPSRKSFIGNILNLPAEERIEGSIAASVACILYGANILRVHDVKEAKRAALVADAIKRSAA